MKDLWCYDYQKRDFTTLTAINLRQRAAPIYSLLKSSQSYDEYICRFLKLKFVEKRDS